MSLECRISWQTNLENGLLIRENDRNDNIFFFDNLDLFNYGQAQLTFQKSGKRITKFSVDIHL